MLITLRNVKKEVSLDKEILVDVHFVAEGMDGSVLIHVLETNKATGKSKYITYIQQTREDDVTRYMRRNKMLWASNNSLDIRLTSTDDEVLLATNSDNELGSYRVIPTVLHKYSLGVTKETRDMYPRRTKDIEEYACWGFELALTLAKQNEIPYTEFDQILKLTEALTTNRDDVNMYWVLDAVSTNCVGYVNHNIIRYDKIDN